MVPSCDQHIVMSTVQLLALMSGDIIGATDRKGILQHVRGVRQACKVCVWFTICNNVLLTYCNLGRLIHLCESRERVHIMCIGVCRQRLNMTEHNVHT